jgi:NADPH:quinone reductase-like Zn-dependent oxidoreductase
MLTPTGVLIPNSIGTSGGFFGGLPRAARAALMARRDAVLVRFVTCVVNRDNLTALAGLLESGKVKVVIDQVHQLDDAARAVAQMATHHARGKAAISVET